MSHLQTRDNHTSNKMELLLCHSYFEFKLHWDCYEFEARANEYETFMSVMFSDDHMVDKHWVGKLVQQHKIFSQISKGVMHLHSFLIFLYSFL